MCTAATLKTKDFYFGRNLDYEFSYGDEVVITPRNYQFNFRNKPAIKSHYAMIGMACVMDDTPLYYEATNEKGLSVAGLNFVGNAHYFPKEEGKDNICQFELIPWLLSQSQTVKDVRKLLENLNITDEPFKDTLPLASLHWLIADKDECIVLECMKDGMHIHDNPVGVLTNNPPFDMQLFNLNNYHHLSKSYEHKTDAFGIELNEYSRGMGALGLPGDLSSASRFVKVAFTRMNSLCNDDEMSSVSQFFHILHSVEQQRGCCHLGDEKYEITLYSSCCNSDKGIYYYTTYNNHMIRAVDMHRVNLDTDTLYRYTINDTEHIEYQN